jgi:hypothetical protein
MALKSIQPCRKCSILAALLLLLQFCTAQYKFGEIDNWLNSNINNLGGRAVLIIYKNDTIIYHQSVNDLSRKQKIIGKYLAKKKGEDPVEALQDFDSHTKERI